MMNELIEYIQIFWNWLGDLLYQVFTTELVDLGEKSFSLSTLVQLILLISVVFVVARIMRKLIRLAILDQLKSVERGTKEAIASMLGYIIAAFGLLIVLQGAGVDLSSLGFIAIGAGFGLQHFASNFISGITLLFEQPLKVGDFVEVGDLRGTVEKISIRSTVIRTNDNFFVIVPNESFIQNNIINWSYTDRKCRLHIPVGVAYGSDTTLVTEALLAAAKKQPHVLKNPKPKVWFREFGDSSLNFDLLVWIDDPPAFQPITSDLNYAIELELDRRDIEIPFPQRDLHLKNPEKLIPIFQGSAHQQEAQNGQEVKTTSKSQHVGLENLLRKISYFQQFTRRQIRELIEDGHREILPKDHLICREGDPGDSFYIILSGSVEIFLQKLDKHIVNRHAGEFIGEMSLLMGIKRSASIRTLEETTLFVLDRNNLKKLLKNHPGLADQISQELAKRRESLESIGLKLDKMASEENLFRLIRRRISTLFHI